MTLWGKLVCLRSSIQAIVKDVQGEEFKFAKISKVLHAVRPEMDNLKILLKEEVVGSEIRPLNPGYFAKVKMQFTWINSENESEREPCLFEGIGVDNTERAIGIAESYCEKMFLLKNLQIPLDDMDPDTKQKIKDPEPPIPEKEPPTFEFVDFLCSELKTESQWANAYGQIMKTQEFTELDGKEMDEALEYYNRLYNSWRSCQ